MSPASAASSEASTPLDPSATFSSDNVKSLPTLRSNSERNNLNPMNSTQTPQGLPNLARSREQVPAASQQGFLARAKAFQNTRMAPNSSLPASRSPGGSGSPASGFRGVAAGHPVGSSQKRPDPNVPAMNPGGSLGMARNFKLNGKPALNSRKPQMQLTMPNDDSNSAINGAGQGTRLSDFDNYIDSGRGWLTFDGTAIITKEGVKFENGTSFQISLDEIEVLDELGKGNYGTVYKARHGEPRVPRFGPGLSNFRKLGATGLSSFTEARMLPAPPASVPNLASVDGKPGRVMAMKEIRLELEESKFKAILKELVILHTCASPFIIEFYGAFFQEGSVYMCIEYMDGGSVDQLYTGGIQEQVLRKITYATIVGLKYLKEKHNIIHRDVKPTNVLVNTKGQVKICDFGVSGNLVASLAKTQIGCQSYMAPERIMQGNATLSAVGQEKSTYSVSSDIWSLGLSIIECATGKYPYPSEASKSILGQLNVSFAASRVTRGHHLTLQNRQLLKESHRSSQNRILRIRETLSSLA